MQAFQDMQDRALEDVARVELHVHFIDWSKTDIAAEAGRLGVPIAETWSCYKGEARHCGRCGTCVERLEALHEAGVPDPTEYEDTTYWRQAVSDKEKSG
jgi:7-cyano-7-deazaguanine synthase